MGPDRIPLSPTSLPHLVAFPAESDNRGDAFWEGVTAPLGYEARATGWRRSLGDCMSIRVHVTELGDV
jgi:hypothetical protein